MNVCRCFGAPACWVFPDHLHFWFFPEKRRSVSPDIPPSCLTCAPAWPPRKPGGVHLCTHRLPCSEREIRSDAGTQSLVHWHLAEAHLAAPLIRVHSSDQRHAPSASMKHLFRVRSHGAPVVSSYVQRAAGRDSQGRSVTHAPCSSSQAQPSCLRNTMQVARLRCESQACRCSIWLPLAPSRRQRQLSRAPLRALSWPSRGC